MAWLNYARFAKIRKLFGLKALFFASFLFVSIFGVAKADLTLNFQGYTTVNGTPLCTPSDTSSCSSIAPATPVTNPNTFIGMLSQYAGVSQNNLSVGSVTAGGSYSFGSGTLIDGGCSIGNCSSVANVNGYLTGNPESGVPVRATYVCSGPGIGNNVPISAQPSSNNLGVGNNYSWTASIPTGGSDVSCDFRVEYQDEPSASSQAAPACGGPGNPCQNMQCRSGACTLVQSNPDGSSVPNGAPDLCSSAQDCQTNLTVWATPTQTVQRGGSGIYLIRFKHEGKTWPTQVNVICPSGTQCNLVSPTGNILSRCYLDSNNINSFYCNLNNPPYTGTTLETFFTAPDITYILLVKTNTSTPVGNHNISVQASTFSQRLIDPNDPYSGTVNDCFGTCQTSTIPLLVVQAACGNGVLDSGEVCDSGISYGTDSSGCGSGACAGTRTKTCNNTCTGYDFGSCTYTVNTCDDGNTCTGNGSCVNGTCQTGSVVSGSYCQGNACVANTASVCAPSCTSNAQCGALPPIPDLKCNGQDSLSLPSGSDCTLSWTVGGGTATSCTASGNWSGSKSTSGGSETQTNITTNKAYTITCSNVNGSNSDTVNVTISAGSCPAASVSLSSSSVTTGGSVTASAPSGWSGGSFSSANSGVASVSGSAVTGVSAGATSISGSGWTASNGATNCSLSGTGVTVSAPVSCPAGSVSLTSNNIGVGATTQANAPSGWSGGNFISSNTSKATVSGSTVTGQASGSSSITGSGWTASNGATNCSLSGATVNVSVLPPSGDIKCNGGDSCTIPASNTGVTLSWTSQNTTDCDVYADGGSGGPYPGPYLNQVNNPSQPTTNISSSVNYVLNCAGPGGSGQYDSVAITVTGTPDFSISHTPASRQVTQGGSTTFTINLTSINGFNDRVRFLSTINCPTNATCSFSPATPNLELGSAFTTMTVTTQASTPIGTNNMIVQARDDSVGFLFHTTSPVVEVVAPPAGTAPVLTLSANPTNVNAGQTTQLTWSSTGTAPVTCNSVSGSWSVVNGAASGNTTSSALNAASTFTMTCSNAYGSDTESVSVSVNVDSPGNPGGGGGSSCGQIVINWSDTSGENGYYIYRNTSNTFPGVGGRIATLGQNVVTYTDTPPTSTNYYWVSAYNNAGESAPVALGNNPLGASTCNASLSSNKDITRINSLVPSGYTTNAYALNETPPNVVYNKGDLVSFAINLSNNSVTGGEDASNIQITDRLVNLKRPSGGWNMKLGNTSLTEVNIANCSTATTAFQSLNNNQFGACGSEPNQVLYIKVATVAQGSLAVISMVGEVKEPSGYGQASSRFQNSASISYTKGVSGTTGLTSATTPLLLFNIQNVPNKVEVAP
ncbi:MAG: hypothetical protein JNK33_00995 [Candidatus Doudnabacteria bacterium]|nr:hypothetical protein [Candidatus Doudnabacteria bacterium]